MRWMRLLLGCMALGICPAGLASDGILVKESTGEISRGVQTGLQVVIPKAKSGDVDKAWQKKLKGYKAKVSSKKGEIFADNASISQLSDNTVDIYSRLTDTVDGASLMVYMDLGGAWLTSASHAQQYKVAENLIYLFAVEQARDALGIEIKGAEDKLSEMTRMLDRLDGEKRSLEKEIDNHTRNIEKAQEGIKEANKLLEKNASAKDAQLGEIEKQKGVIQALRLAQEGVK